MANAAWKTHLLRLKHFKEQSKEADNKSFDEVLTRARITIMEYDLFTALVHSLNSPKVAKGELDRLIEMLDKAKLVVGDLGRHVMVVRAQSAAWLECSLCRRCVIKL